VLAQIEAEMPRGDACVAHLVVAFGAESDRVGGRRVSGELAMKSAHRGAVESAREEVRRIGVGMAVAHGVAQRRLQVVRERLDRRGRALSKTEVHRRARRSTASKNTVARSSLAISLVHGQRA
jgi:hypothetical protein